MRRYDVPPTIVALVLALLGWAGAAHAQNPDKTALLTLGGWGPPPGPHEVFIPSVYNPVPPNHRIMVIDQRQLMGLEQIAADARISEVRLLRISSGTFAPGTIQAQMRPLLSSNGVYLQVPTGAFGPPPFTSPLEVHGVNLRRRRHEHFPD